MRVFGLKLEHESGLKPGHGSEQMAGRVFELEKRGPELFLVHVTAPWLRVSGPIELTGPWLRVSGLIELTGRASEQAEHG